MANVRGTEANWGQLPSALAIPDITKRVGLSNINAIALWDNSNGWWKKCRHTSWWQEVGKPPMLACVVGTDDVVNIYGVQDMSLWMSFENESLYILHSSGDAPSSVDCLENLLVVGKSNGLFIIDFASDVGRRITGSTYEYAIGDIGNRNSAGNYSLYTTSTKLVNGTVNSVDIATIDGLTYIAAGTDGGVSIVRLLPDGRVDTSYGTSGVVDSSRADAMAAVRLLSGDIIYAENSGSVQIYVTRDVPEIGDGFTPVLAAGYYYASIPAYNKGVISSVECSDRLLIGGASGLTILSELRGDETNGKVQYVTKDYITPPMKGDVRGAYVPALTDTSYTQDSEGTVIDRSDSAMDLTPKGGNVSVANFGDGAAKAFSFDGANYLQQETFDTEQNELELWHDDLSNFRIQTTSITDGATEDTVTVAVNGDDLFADGDRVVAYDETGYSVPGVVDGSPSATSIDVDDGAGADPGEMEKVGVYANFPGTTSDFINLGNPASLNFTSQVTIEGWVWIDSSSSAAAHTYIGKNYTTSWTFFLYNNGTMRLDLQGVGVAKYSGVGTVPTDTWVHICATYDGSNLTYYVNGAQVATWVLSGTISTDASNVEVGRDSIYPMKGKIAEVRAYNIGLTAADALWLATNPNPSVSDIFSNTSAVQGGGAADDNLVLYHNYRNQNATDLSEYGNDGTVQGSVTYSQLAYISKSLIPDGDCENGGIGALDIGPAYTASKTSSGVYRDTLSLETQLASSPVTADRPTFFAIFPADFVVRGYGKVTGGSAAVHFCNSSKGGLGAIVPALTSDWQFFESCGTSSAPNGMLLLPNAGATMTVDSIQLLPNLVDNGGMEGTYVAGVAPGWSALGSPDTVAEEASTVHSGSKSQKVEVTSGGYKGIQTTAANAIVSGQWYQFSCWLYITSGSVYVDWVTSDHGNISSSTTGSWHRVSYKFLCTSSNDRVNIRSNNGNAVFYVDDVSAIPLASYDANPTHFIDSGYLGDTAQDFSDYETTSGDADYMAVVTTEEGDVCWGYLGDATTKTNSNDMIPVYQDISRSTAGFNGTLGTPSSYVVRDTKAQITGALTVAAWVKSPSGGDDLLSKWDTTIGQESYILGLNGSGYGMLIVTGNGSSDIAAVGSVDISDDNWHLIAGVLIPSTSVTLYVDGVQVAQNTTSIPSSIFDSYAPLLLGASFNSGSVTRHWVGEEAHPLILAEALTAAEIKEMYDWGYAQLNAPASSAALPGSSNQVNGLAFDDEREILWAGTEDGAVALQTQNGWVVGAMDIDGNGTEWGYGDSRTDDDGAVLFQDTNNDINVIAAGAGTVAFGSESEAVIDTLDGKTVMDAVLEGIELPEVGPHEVVIAEWRIDGNLATGDQQGGRVSLKGDFDPAKLVAVVTTTGDTSGDTSIDLNADGASILYASVDVAYNDSDGVVSTTEFDLTGYPFGLPDGTLLDIDIDSIPGGTTSTDLRVLLYGTPREES